MSRRHASGDLFQFHQFSKSRQDIGKHNRLLANPTFCSVAGQQTRNGDGRLPRMKVSCRAARNWVVPKLLDVILIPDGPLSLENRTKAFLTHARVFSSVQHTSGPGIDTNFVVPPFPSRRIPWRIVPDNLTPRNQHCEQPEPLLSIVRLFNVVFRSAKSRLTRYFAEQNTTLVFRTMLKVQFAFEAMRNANHSELFLVAFISGTLSISTRWKTVSSPRSCLNISSPKAKPGNETISVFHKPLLVF